MNSRNLLLTHTAVFACGAAVAFFIPRSGTETTAGPDGSGRAHRSSSSAAGSSAESDPAAAAGSRGGSSRREASEKTPRGPEAIAARLGEINLIGDPLDRQTALLDLLQRLGPGEFEAVAELHRGTEHFGNARDEFEMILRGWTKADPLGALEYTSSKLNDIGQTSLVLSAWASTDAGAAERWALDHHQGDEPNPYLAAIVRGIAAHDIASASRIAGSMPAGRERGEAMESITRALLVQGTEAAMAYPATVEDPQLRAGYVAMIADRLARRDAEKAATWLAGVNDPEAQNRGARGVAEALARQDVSRAADWVRKLDPAAQAEAARGVIIPMSSSDIAATARWVTTLSGIPNYDRVVEEFVWSCDQRAPEQSAAWIQGVSDPAQQTRLYHRMLGEWSRRDPAAVRNWVASNKVPNSVAQRFSR